MKRIISLLLLLVFTAGVSVIQVYAEKKEIDFRYKQMIDLEFLNEEEDPDYIVTRGEFAKVVCSVYKLDEENIKKTVFFEDVSYNDEYYSCIQTVASENIMSGYGDGNFAPEKPITAAEATRVIVSLLGYENEAFLKGGYPEGFTDVAKNIKLYKNTGIKNYNASLRQNELGIMIYNLMISEMNEVRKVKSNMIGYEKSDKIFAQKIHGLRYITGIVSANSYTNFSDYFVTAGDNRIAVDDTLLTVKDFKDRFFIGRYVSIFYNEETEDIVSIIERQEDENILEFMYYDVERCSENDVWFTTDNKTIKAKLSDETIYIYNDKMFLYYDITKLNDEKNYRLVLIDNDDDNRYDIVFIEKYYVVVSDGINTDNEAVNKLMEFDETENKYKRGKSVSVDENTEKEFFICDDNYDKIDAESIKNGDVLTVVENDDYIKILVSKNNTECVIDKVTHENNLVSVINCNSEDFYAVKELEGFIKNNKLAGKSVKIYFDVFKNAAYIECKDIDNEKVGLLINAKLITDDDDGESGIYFKIFTEDEKEIKTQSENKISINGKRYDVQRLKTLPEEFDLSKNLPVIYKVNENGRIIRINLPAEKFSGNEDGFFFGNSVKNVTYNVHQNIFGGKIKCDKETLAFLLNSQTYNEATCSVLRGDGYDTTRLYTVDGYYTSKNDDTADIIVIQSKTDTINFDSPTVVITNTTQKVLYDEEICTKLEYFSKGGIKEAYVNESKYPDIDISVLGAGDTVRLNIDKDGYLTDFIQVYSCTQNKYTLNANPTSRSYTDSVVCGWGYVARITDGNVRLSDEKKEINDTSVFDLPLHVISGYDVILVLIRGEKCVVEKCNENEIRYGDKAVWVTRGGRGKSMVIYRQAE